VICQGNSIEINTRTDGQSDQLKNRVLIFCFVLFIVGDKGTILLNPILRVFHAF
jgi:hypothetical protein